jgi:hypothetical protein
LCPAVGASLNSGSSELAIKQERIENKADCDRVARTDWATVQDKEGGTHAEDDADDTDDFTLNENGNTHLYEKNLPLPRKNQGDVKKVVDIKVGRKKKTCPICGKILHK